MVEMMKYTPILKWKKAEESALKELQNNQKDAVLPLLEFIRPNKSIKRNGAKVTICVDDDELVNELSSKIPQDILLSWGDGRSFLADFSLIAPTKARARYSAGFFRK